MAEAMIHGLIRREVAPAEALLAAGPEVDRLEELKDEYQITCHFKNNKAAQQADVVVLSVKPQRLDRVLDGLKGSIQPEALVLSIVAGASIEKISRGLDHSLVVRSMPNTPAQIGEGITVWTASRVSVKTRKTMTRSILGALGDEIYVEEETYLDMATALSGTGPAYVFLIYGSHGRCWCPPGFPTPDR